MHGGISPSRLSAVFQKDIAIWSGDSDPANATGSCLYLRWLQFGAVAPVLRTHCGGCGPNGPPTCPCERRVWLFATHFSEMRDALVLRAGSQSPSFAFVALVMRFVMRSIPCAALLPYLYTAARGAYDTGIGPLRPVYYSAPLLDDAYGPASAHEYMFGPDILAVCG